jgi:hypothetical protein
MTLLLKSSSTTNSPTVKIGAPQPVEIASDRPIGIAAAIHGAIRNLRALQPPHAQGSRVSGGIEIQSD